jgi:membrane protein
MHRALGFAALGFVALMPLLVVIAATSPVDYGGFGQWVVDGMGLSGDSERIVKHLFAPTHHALSSTDALGLVIVCVFSQTFASSVQTGYEKVWDLQPQMRHRLWQQVLWLAALTGQFYAEALSSHNPVAWTELAARCCGHCCSGAGSGSFSAGEYAGARSCPAPSSPRSG